MALACGVVIVLYLSQAQALNDEILVLESHRQADKLTPDEPLHSYHSFPNHSHTVKGSLIEKSVLCSSLVRVELDIVF